MMRQATDSPAINTQVGKLGVWNAEDRYLTVMQYEPCGRGRVEWNGVALTAQQAVEVANACASKDKRQWIFHANNKVHWADMGIDRGRGDTCKIAISRIKFSRPSRYATWFSYWDVLNKDQTKRFRGLLYLFAGATLVGTVKLKQQTQREVLNIHDKREA